MVFLGKAPEISIGKVACDTSPKECVKVCPRRREERDILVGEITGLKHRVRTEYLVFEE